MKDIPGYEGVYAVTDDGKVWSHARVNVNGRRCGNKWMSTYTDKDGYLFYKLTSQSRTKRFYAHRVVALTYIENINNKSQVNHIDGNKQNNHVSNLEWVTAKENTAHAIKVLNIDWAKNIVNFNKTLNKQRETWKIAQPLAAVAAKLSHQKKVVQYDLFGVVINKFTAVREAAKFYGINETGIARVCRGEKKTYKGFIWKFDI